MNERLRILCEQEYIGRNYSGRSKLYGKPATYYLLDKGIDVLKQSPEGYDRKALAQLKRKVNNNGMWHYINVFRTFIRCRELYGDDIKFLTRSNLYAATYFPKVRPDAYIVFNDPDTNETARAMIEYFDWSKPLSRMKRRISDLIAYSDSGEWTAKVPFPEIWIICETPELEHKIRKWTEAALEKAWDDKATIYTTTKTRFFDKNSSDLDIWQLCNSAQ